MAKTAEKQSTNSDLKIRERIIDGYKEYKLMNGEEPASVYAFVKSLKLKEEQFFEHFSSFTDLESAIWESMIGQVLEVIHKDENYPHFNVREKLLSFYYTFLEVLKSDRSYVLLELKDVKPALKELPALKKLKHHYLEFVHGLMTEGNDTGEIPKRPFISDQYKHGFWVQLLFIAKDLRTRMQLSKKQSICLWI